MLLDDHPWPELGSVSRGATRGNQGSKGSLSSPDTDGRCVLQLRVQPGVLAVTLTRQASEWYRILDVAVSSALKLTKGYWRKARRRQDYDAQADQDHIELNEWLQQLKDKVMAHLEMLIAKGEIRGPPYVMSEDQDFPFLRKFIERQAAGIPHNPRLRGIITHENRVDSSHSLDSIRSLSPEDSKIAASSFHEEHLRLLESEEHNVASTSSGVTTQPAMRPQSHSRIGSLVRNAQNNKLEIESARKALMQARKDSKIAFQKYNSLIETERRAQDTLAAAEERQAELMISFIDFYNTQSNPFSSHSSPNSVNTRPTPPFLPPQIPQQTSHHHSMSSPSFHTPRHTPLSMWETADRHDRSTSTFNNGATVAVNQFTNSDRQSHWAQPDGRINMNGNGFNHPDPTAMRQTLHTSIPMASGFMPQMPVSRGKKHAREWTYGEMEDHSANPEDLAGMPSRKRAHSMAGNLRMSDGLHMVTSQDALSAPQPPSHLSAAPQSHFRDAPT